MKQASVSLVNGLNSGRGVFWLEGHVLLSGCVQNRLLQWVWSLWTPSLGGHVSPGWTLSFLPWSFCPQPLKELGSAWTGPLWISFVGFRQRAHTWDWSVSRVHIFSTHWSVRFKPRERPFCHAELSLHCEPKKMAATFRRFSACLKLSQRPKSSQKDLISYLVEKYNFMCNWQLNTCYYCRSHNHFLNLQLVSSHERWCVLHCLIWLLIFLSSLFWEEGH